MVGLAEALPLGVGWPDGFDGVDALGEATAGADDIVWGGRCWHGRTGVSG